MSHEGSNAESLPIENRILPTDIDWVDGETELLIKKLNFAGWDEDSIYGVQIAFREALINAIAHGNLGVSVPDLPDGVFKDLSELAKEEQEKNPTDKKIYVSFKINPEEAVVTIRDEGEGFDWKKVPDPTRPEGLGKTKGRGIMFMENFVDSVSYNEKGNEVTLTKKRSV